MSQEGRSQVDLYKNPVSRHSIQSYILTNYRLGKSEPLIALGSHQEEPLISVSVVSHRVAEGTDFNTLTWLAEVVPNCLVVS